MLRVPRELFLTWISPKQQVTNHVFIVIMNNFHFFSSKMLALLLFLVKPK